MISKQSVLGSNNKWNMYTAPQPGKGVIFTWFLPGSAGEVDGTGIVTRPSLHLKVGCLELWYLYLRIIRIFHNHHHISHCHLQDKLIIKNCTGKSYPAGILLWEMATLGASPYPGVPHERLVPLLAAGYRFPEISMHCNDSHIRLLFHW